MTQSRTEPRQGYRELWWQAGCDDPCEGTLAMRLLWDRVMESYLQQWLKDTAWLMGWTYYHTHDARRSDAGFPDTALVRPPRFLLIEVKRQTRYVFKEAQITWFTHLRNCPGVEVTLLRPCCQQRVSELLR